MERKEGFKENFEKAYDKLGWEKESTPVWGSYKEFLNAMYNVAKEINDGPLDATTALDNEAPSQAQKASRATAATIHIAEKIKDRIRKKGPKGSASAPTVAEVNARKLEYFLNLFKQPVAQPVFTDADGTPMAVEWRLVYSASHKGGTREGSKSQSILQTEPVMAADPQAALTLLLSRNTKIRGGTNARDESNINSPSTMVMLYSPGLVPNQTYKKAYHVFRNPGTPASAPFWTVNWKGGQVSEKGAKGDAIGYAFTYQNADVKDLNSSPLLKKEGKEVVLITPAGRRVELYLDGQPIDPANVSVPDANHVVNVEGKGSAKQPAVIYAHNDKPIHYIRGKTEEQVKELLSLTENGGTGMSPNLGSLQGNKSKARAIVAIMDKDDGRVYVSGLTANLKAQFWGPRNRVIPNNNPKGNNYGLKSLTEIIEAGYTPLAIARLAPLISSHAHEAESQASAGATEAESEEFGQAMTFQGATKTKLSGQVTPGYIKPIVFDDVDAFSTWRESLLEQTQRVTKSYGDFEGSALATIVDTLIEVKG